MTTPATASPPQSGTHGISPRQAKLALAVLMLGTSMSLIDATIVNVALPTIRTSIDASESTLSWIISGYALAYGLALIPAGRLGDRFGHKWVFFAGLALFALASLACGFAQDSIQLVVARVVQGLAGGIYFPAVTAFIQLLFTGRARGTAFAVLGAVIGVASALGPLAGGLLIEAFGEENGWRAVFFVNVPIGIIALIAAVVLLPSGAEGRESTGIDLVGLLLLSGGLVALLVPLIQGQDEGWPLWTYLSLAGGAVLIALFAFWELRVVRRGRSPLVPPHLFSHAAFTGGSILALVYFAAFTSIFFTISIFWQSGLGHTALESGLVTIGLTSLWLVLLLVPAADLTSWELLGPLLVAGLGSGLFIAPNAQFIIATVDRAEAGAASGVIGTMQRVGSAIGIAVIGSVFFGTLVLPDGRPTADDVAVSFSHSAAAALAISAAFAFVAFLLVFTLPKRVDQGRG